MTDAMLHFCYGRPFYYEFFNLQIKYLIYLNQILEISTGFQPFPQTNAIYILQKSN